MSRIVSNPDGGWDIYLSHPFTDPYACDAEAEGGFEGHAATLPVACKVLIEALAKQELEFLEVERGNLATIEATYEKTRCELGETLDRWGEVDDALEELEVRKARPTPNVHIGFYGGAV